MAEKPETMKKQPLPNCESCGRQTDARLCAIASPDAKTFRYFCSAECKEIGKQIIDPLTPKTAAGPGKIKKPPRTKSEIRRARRPSETQVKQTIQNDLDLSKRVWNVRLQSGAVKLANGAYMKLCKQGTPDNVFLDGIICFLEIKKPEERPDDIQILTHELIRKSGGLCFVVDNYEDYLFIYNRLKTHRRALMQVQSIANEIQNDIDRALTARNKEK